MLHHKMQEGMSPSCFLEGQILYKVCLTLGAWFPLCSEFPIFSNDDDDGGGGPWIFKKSQELENEL